MLVFKFARKKAPGKTHPSLPLGCVVCGSKGQRLVAAAKQKACGMGGWIETHVPLEGR